MTVNLVAEHDTTADAAVEAADGQAVYPYYLRGVDPRELRATGHSRVVGDIRATRPELVASVAEHGVDPKVSVINVVPEPDGVLAVLVGFHRHAAAVEVKGNENPHLTIGALVHEPGTTRQDILIAQGIENIHRVGYTETEEADLFEQLTLEGLDEDTIALKLTRPVERVRAGRAVVASPRTHTAGQDLPEVDLVTLAQLAEFADDEQDHQQLVEVLNTRPRDLDHTIGQLRRSRQGRELRSAEQERLTAEGYALIESTYHLPDGVARLDELCAGDDQAPLDPAEHATCPGRAAAVTVYAGRDVEITEFCVNFAEHGHRTITAVKVDAAEAQLREQGVRIVDPTADTMAELSGLFADEQAAQTMTVDQHAGCPGHAAYVDQEPDGPTAEVFYVCDNFAAHGHVLLTAAPARPERNAAYLASERKRAAMNNQAWREAKGDRREWLREHFASWRKYKPATASKSATSKRRSAQSEKAALLPPRVHHWLALAEVLASDYLADAAPAHRYACTLLGLDEPEGNQRDRNPIAALLRKKTTTETQAVIIRLAQVIGACEEHWDKSYTDGSGMADATWRRPNQDSRFYFELLDTLSYPLSAVQQLVNNPAADADKWPHLATDSADGTLAA
jgi:ParB family chromosome partitioning protein